tara:strand:+ start:19772 stop:20146 length:375 start_codon:yes stop_codon:yes gene_type:complete
MEKILEQKEVRFSPLNGDFDIASINDMIGKVEFVYRDLYVENLFMFFLDEDSMKEAVKYRESNHNIPLPNVFIVKITPKEVYFNLHAGPKFKPHARIVLEYLIKNYNCRVKSGNGEDLTDDFCL